MLNDNSKGIFCVMTSNNVQELPPELTRTGRLDCIWYFTEPNELEREEILNIHFNKRKYSIDDKILKHIAFDTKGYTGAELEQIVKIAIRKAYIEKKKNNLDKVEIKESIIKSAIKDVIPVSKSSREKILALENWAKNRALYANESIKEIDIDKALEDIKLEEII